jgi:glycosyltransferase involved in cell wall biosynthesis
MSIPAITTIILSYNEEKHIERCIKNAQQFSQHIFLVDSFSTDKTKNIAESLGAIVYQHKWENNYARQFNWGLQNLPITTEWVFRLDADEYLSDELIAEIKTKFFSIPLFVTGIVMERKMIFMGKLIKKGNVKWNMLRLFRNGKGLCEERWMDEHIVLSEGVTQQWQHCFYDDNLNSLGWWISKHNGYSIREAVDLLDIEYDFLPKPTQMLSTTMSADAANKRNKKKKYASMPLFWRSFIYFLYRYFIKLGFTEGTTGFIWHFLQGWWYRSLVDAKVYEIKKACNNDPKKMKEYIYQQYQLKLD